MLLKCEVCDKDLMSGKIEQSSIYLCCKTCEPAYQKVIRLEERLKAEEDKVDEMQGAILRLLKTHPANYVDGKTIIDSQLFEELYDAAHLRWNKADTYSKFLEEQLVEGRLLIDAFKIFHSEKHIRQDFKKNIKEKLTNLLDSCNKVNDFHGWNESQKFDYSVEDVIKQVKEFL